MPKKQTPRAWNSTLPAARKPMKRSPMKNRGKRLKVRSRGRSPEAKLHAERKPDCELCSILHDVQSYVGFSACYGTGHPRFGDSEVHHIFHPPRFHHDSNLITLCGVCHDYCERCWQQAGMLACTWVKIVDGTFDREYIRERWRIDPINWLDAYADPGGEGGPFDDDPVLSCLMVLVKDSF